jgi:hypothetical protein
MIFQKKPGYQRNKYMFTLGSTVLEHTMKYTYLGLDITASGSFNMAVNALKEKACKAVYAIKSKFYNKNIPVSIWCKLFDRIIQRCMEVRSWVHSVLMTTFHGISIQ